MMTTKPTTEFDRVFKDLEAPDYPATCDQCGLEGTNATIDSHICNEPPVPRAVERDTAGIAPASALQLAQKVDQIYDTDLSNHLVAAVQIQHNQHAILVEQRERLLEALGIARKMFDYIAELSRIEQAHTQAVQGTRMINDFLVTTIEQEGESQ